MMVDYFGDEMSVDPDEDIGGTVARGDVWEPEVRALIYEHLEPGDTAVDVGANLGVHTLAMADAVGSSGTVLALEPHPVTHRHLSATIQANELWYVHPLKIAVMPEEGKVELQEIRENDTGMVSAAGIDAWEDDVESHTAIGRPFDDIVAVDHIDFLKMDIEGVEIGVVPTLDLDRIDRMLIELHDFAYSDTDKHELIQYLGDHGSVQTTDREVLWH